MRINLLIWEISAMLIALPAPAMASQDGIEINPILDVRARYEAVEQGLLDADVATLRLRAGAEATIGTFSVLAEGEATGVMVNNYNAFPFVISDSQRHPQYAVVPDPQNVELNRLQIQYKSAEVTLTAGRQRINLEDQRWVGSVGWRQNEQTFDAVRGEAALGPVIIDLTYAISQRTIFGEDAGQRAAIDGKFLFASIASRPGPVRGALFSYMINYDESFALPNSSQTYGGYLTAVLTFGKGTKLTLRASYARQSDYGRNPFDYAADYWSFDAGTKLGGFSLNGGWERLGSDNGRAVQTPLATLHKFNGWADLFLTTPPGGLEDSYISVGRVFDDIKALPGLKASLVFHQFDSARQNIEYGTEWDASTGFRLGRIAILLKYADYNAKGFGLDTRKFWLQAEYTF